MKDAVLLCLIYWAARLAGWAAVRLDHPKDLPPFKPPIANPAELPRDDIYGCTSWRGG